MLRYNTIILTSDVFKSERTSFFKKTEVLAEYRMFESGSQRFLKDQHVSESIHVD